MNGAIPGSTWDQTLRRRIGKVLAYILRYGAAKEGLTVIDGDFVYLDELLECSLLRDYEKDLLTSVIVDDISFRGVKLFELKNNGAAHRRIVRAAYGRRLEESQFHPNSKVKKLGELCLLKIVQHIRWYDFQDFTDDYITCILIQRLRKERALNNTTLECVLPSSLEILDLEGCYLTPKSLDIVRTRCPRLRVLNLRRHGYVMTDQNLHRLLQSLPQLETLNLTCCHNLTGRCLDSIRTHCRELHHLNLFGIPGIRDDQLLNFLCLAEKLTYLDIFDRKAESALFLETAVEVVRQRGIVLLHKDIRDPEVCPRQALTAHLGERGRFW